MYTMLSSEPDTIHYNENVHKALKDDKIKKKKLYTPWHKKHWD